jgi:hypothetical protein
VTSCPVMGSRMVMAASFVQVHGERRVPAYGSFRLELWLRDSYCARALDPKSKTRRYSRASFCFWENADRACAPDQQEHGRAAMVNEWLFRHKRTPPEIKPNGPLSLEQVARAVNVSLVLATAA